MEYLIDQSILLTEDYMCGKIYTKELITEPLRGSTSILEKVKELKDIYPHCVKRAEKCTTYKQFYELELDLNHIVEKDEKEEIFYAMKTKKVVTEAPTKLLFLLELCYSQYGTFNVFNKVLSKKDFTEIYSKGYLKDGYTVNDIICSVYDETFKPMNKDTYSGRNNSNFDVYLEEENRIAILPKKLYDMFSVDDIKALKVIDNDIVLGTKPIRFLGDYYGAVSSTYNLSQLY